MCVYVCVQNLPFQIIPPSFFSLSPSLSLSLSLPPSLRIPIEQRKGKKRKKFETDTRDLSAGARVHCPTCPEWPTFFFFLFASTDACLFLPPSFLLSSPPPYAAPGGWMAGAKSKQVWQVAQRRKTGAPAGRLALPTSATPALLCEPAARGCCVTVVRRRLSSAEHCSGPLLAPSSCFRPPPAVAPARDQSGPDARPASEMWRV